MNTTWSRREFLELSGASVGASLAPTSLRAGRVPPSDTVRFGMVGVGMQGSGLLGESIKLPGVACAGAADLYDGRHTLAREIAGATLPVTRRYQQLLDDKTIDCIVAAVPDHWHQRIVVDAVSAGKAIYCEKPMSHTAADGVAMVDAVKPTNRIVQIGSQRVSSQICAKARELIAQGAIGELMMVEGSLGTIPRERGSIPRRPISRRARSTGIRGKATYPNARSTRTSSRAGAVGRSTAPGWRVTCSSISSAACCSCWASMSRPGRRWPSAG